MIKVFNEAIKNINLKMLQCLYFYLQLFVHEVFGQDGLQCCPWQMFAKIRPIVDTMATSSSTDLECLAELDQAVLDTCSSSSTLVMVIKASKMVLIMHRVWQGKSSGIRLELKAKRGREFDIKSDFIYNLRATAMLCLLDGFVVGWLGLWASVAIVNYLKCKM